MPAASCPSTAIVVPCAVAVAGAAGHQPRRLMRSRLNGHACDFADAFDDSLDVEEVDVAGAAAPVFRLRHSRPCARERAALALRAREARANLEQPHVALFAAAVVRDRVDEARQRRRPQNGKRFGQRIRDRHDVAVGGEGGGGGISHEAEGHGFGEAGAGEGAAHLARAHDPWIHRARRRGRRRERRRQAIEAVVPAPLPRSDQLRAPHRRARSAP